MQIHLAIPSFARPRVETLKYLPQAHVYVSESQVREYAENNPTANIIAVDPKYQGNVCRIRNRILDMNPGKAVCIVDDDLQFLAYWEDKKMVKLKDEIEVMGFLQKHTQLALDLGVKLWGVNVNRDKQTYREYTPFSLTSYIGSPFSVHLDSPIRYDERFSLKEDYDLTLQHLLTYRKVLRVNRYFYAVRQVEQVGGVATYRNTDREIAQLKDLQKKWGSGIVKFDDGVSRSHNSKKKRKLDINPIIRVPISGI